MTRQWFTTSQVAQELGLSRTTVRKLIAQKQIKAKRFGKWWRIPAEELERVLREGISLGGGKEG